MSNDSGAHYRFTYQIALNDGQCKQNKAVIKLDPYRIADIYGIANHAQFSALKKILVAGDRGYKGLTQDIDDSINALERWKEMIQEDQLNQGIDNA